MKNQEFKIRIVVFFLTLFSGFMLHSWVVEAGTHYVSPQGGSTWSACKNTSINCSPTTAMSNAIAGDIVYFRGGTYTVGQSQPYQGVLQPSNSGTIENPIKFIAYPEENPIIDSTADASHDNSYGMGNGNQNYIIFDGFTFQANGGEKMGGIIIHGNSISDRSVGCIIKNCIFYGGTRVIPTEDNRELIRLENTSYITIQNSTIYSANGNYLDTKGINMYFNDHATIENCEFYDNKVAIHAKADNNDLTVRNCYFHNNYYSFYFSIYGPGNRNCDRLKIYNCVFANNGFNAIAGIAEETSHIDDLELYNNTVYNSVRAFNYARTIPGHGAKIYNNISLSNTHDSWVKTPGKVAESDHNNWGNDGMKITMDAYGENNVYTSLSSWQNSEELEGGGNPGLGSITADPLFVNSSGNFSLLSDFQLLSNSPCIGSGRNLQNMGADVQSVGVGSSVPDAPEMPSSPRDFTREE